MTLQSFTASRRFNTEHGQYFLVEDDAGKSGVCDPKKTDLVVPCEFEDIYSTKFPNLWIVTEHGRNQGREFGSKGVAGVYDATKSRLIIPTVCEQVLIHNADWFVITIQSKQHFRWRKLGLYSVTNNKLYIDTSYEKDWIPRWSGLKVVPTPIPATRYDEMKIIAHGDDILIIDMFDGWPRIFSRKLGKIIYPVEKA
jgi:hypothetical protein